jgi:putative transposase
MGFMPRLARLDAAGVLHHVMGRGIEKRKIFFGDQDRSDFLDRLAALGEKKWMDIYAWTLLPNHFHLLCRTGGKPLATSMRKLLTGYVVNFNIRHGRHGHLFQNRYKSIICQEESYLTELVRYIHLNLLRVGVVKDMEGLNDSLWSGHSALVGKVKRPWQDTAYVLGYFGKGIRGRRNYLKFVEEGIPLGRRPEMVGGGLVRSLGGWSEVLALRARTDRQISDQRILGDGEFVEAVWREMNERGKDTLRVNRQRMGLGELAERVCGEHGVSVNELRAGSRRREVIRARQDFSQVAVKLLGFAGADAGRYLGVTSSCVTRVASQEERLEELKIRYGIC